MSWSIQTWFRAQTMRMQVGIWKLLILFIVLSSVIILFQIHLQLLLPLLASSQRQIFLRDSQFRLRQILYQQKELMKAFIDLNANQLVALHQLILASQYQPFDDEAYLEYNYLGVSTYPDSLDYKSKIYGKISNSFICGSNRTAFNPKNPMSKQIIGASNVMGTLGSLFTTSTFGIESLFYGASFTDPMIVFSYPCLPSRNYFLVYQPDKRPWYKEANVNHNTRSKIEYQLHFTEPYIQVTDHSVDVSLIIPQVDHNDKFIGAWALDFKASVFTKYLQKNNLIDMVLLVNQKGMLLVHNFDNPTKVIPLYMFTEVVTGYSEQDWDLIITNSDQNNNCDPNYQIPGYLCRYNKVLNKDLHIFSTYMKKYELYIIMLSDQSGIKVEIDKSNEIIKEFVQNALIDIITNSIVTFIVGSLIISLIFSFAILRPIQSVKKLIKNYLSPYHNCITQYNLLIKIFNSVDVQLLLLSFNTLLQSLTKSQLTKNRLCQMIENFKFPRRQKLFRIPFRNKYNYCQDQMKRSQKWIDFFATAPGSNNKRQFTWVFQQIKAQRQTLQNE